jgi:hypothetical protein
LVGFFLNLAKVTKIIFITCYPGTELQTFVDLTIAPGVGPEVIAGSTRLKAGTTIRQPAGAVDLFPTLCAWRASATARRRARLWPPPDRGPRLRARALLANRAREAYMLGNWKTF